MPALPIAWISRRDVIVVAVATVLGAPLQPSFPEPGLDPGWLAGLAMAEDRGLIFGREILFTYGPWGWLDHTVMVTRSQLFFQSAFSLLASAALISVLYFLLRSRMSFGYAAAITLLPVTVVCHMSFPDERVLVTAIAGALLLIEYRHRFPKPYLAGFAVGLLTSLFLLVKVSSGILVLPVMGVALLVWWRDWRVPLAGLVGVLLGLPALWLLAGQPLTALPPWLRGSMELAGGYADALSTYPWGWFNYLAYAVVSAFVLMLLWRRLRSGDYYRTQQVALALIGLATVYYGLKLGFVRELDVRLVTAFALLIPVLIFATPSGISDRRAAATVLVAPIAAIAYLPGLFGVVLQPLQSPVGQFRAVRLTLSDQAFTAEGDKQRKSNREHYHLDPELLAQLQGATVQVDPYETSLAWTYNVDWRPVPVFQLYAAYTPYLDQVNTDALSDAAGPAAVLVSAPFPQGIQDANPAWVSPSYQLALGCGYRATSNVRQPWTLLKRESTSGCRPGDDLGTVTAVAHQSVTVPSAPDGSIVTVTFDAEDAALAALQGSFLKPVRPLRLTVGDITYRVPYSLAATPLLLGCPGGGLAIAQGKCSPATIISSDAAGTFTFGSVQNPTRSAP